MASRLASLWKWDFLELGNGLHSTRQSGSLNMHLTSFCANLTASVVIKSLLAETGNRRFSPISNPEIQFYWELQKYGLLGQSPASGPEVVPGSWKNHPFTPFIAPIIFPSSFSPKSRENSVASMEIINSKVKARWEEWKCVSLTIMFSRFLDLQPPSVLTLCLLNRSNVFSALLEGVQPFPPCALIYLRLFRTLHLAR